MASPMSSNQSIDPPPPLRGVFPGGVFPEGVDPDCPVTVTVTVAGADSPPALSAATYVKLSEPLNAALAL
nr:hypothetical protein [Steroidobacter agaridevorans]